MSELTRAQAIEQVGEAAVIEVEGEQLEFTNRVTGNGCVEFSGIVDSVDREGENVRLVMYVLVSEEACETDDLGSIDWDAAIADATFQIL